MFQKALEQVECIKENRYRIRGRTREYTFLSLETKNVTWYDIIEVCAMTCEEAQALIQLLKKIIDVNGFLIPKQGSKSAINIVSVFSDNDRFKVDFNRTSMIRKDKYTLLLRYGKDHGLLRIDVGGPNHTNPDGTIVPCPHIHVQPHDTGMWDAWAYSIPVVFCNVQDRIDTLRQFLEYCNVNNVDSIDISEQTEME